MDVSTKKENFISKIPNRIDATDFLTKISDLPPSSNPRHFSLLTPHVENYPPSARGGHTATKVENKIYFFGGSFSQNNSFVFLNEIHILDITANSWYQPTCFGKIPTGRYFHSAVEMKGKILFFGGRGKNGDLNEIDIFDVKRQRFVENVKSGGTPTPRFGHSCCKIEENKILFFGGKFKNQILNEIFILNFDTMGWKKIETFGKKIQGRYFHACEFFEKKLFVFGGVGEDEKMLNEFLVFDLETRFWSNLRYHGIPPSPRFGHSLTFSENEFFVIGGWTGNKKCVLCNNFNDHKENCVLKKNEKIEKTESVFVFNIFDLTWKKLNLNFKSFYGHSATLAEKHFLIFGGFDGSKSLNVLQVLRDVTEK